MADYTKLIEGKDNLKRINLQIDEEEAAASEFKESVVSISTNEVTFRELPPGTVPKPLILVNAGDPQPPGTRLVWKGAMIVEGAQMEVPAYRKI